MASSGNPTKHPRVDNNFLLCIICQQETKEGVVRKPSSYVKLLNFVKERAQYGDQNFPEINRRLDGLTNEALFNAGATWHSTCYKSAVNTDKCQRAKARFEKALSDRVNICSSHPLPTASNFTRSQSVPFDDNVCFFCDEAASRLHPLHKILSDSAGKNLRTAIECNNNDQFRVKLSTAINPDDAHAIDIRYHKNCWAKNVTHVLRIQSSTPTAQTASEELAADIEFISLVHEAFQAGKVLQMDNLHEAYENIRASNGVVAFGCHRGKLRDLLQGEIDGIEFHRPKRRNEADLVSAKLTRDAAVGNASEAQEIDLADNMKTIFDAACILRKAIGKVEKWTFTGSLSDADTPKELYTFFRWLLQGPNANLSSEGKIATVNRHAQSLVQSTMALCLSDRQTLSKSDAVRYHREMPQQLAVGIAIRQAIRSKKAINLLHGFGISVDYDRLLRLETQIANAVVVRMEQEGVHVPSNIVHGRHIFFAIDNVDFAEDTIDGKNTLHGTAMAIYQRCEPNDPSHKMELINPAHSHSLKHIPDSITTLLPCQMPKTPRPNRPAQPTFNVMTEQHHLTEYKDDLSWLLAHSLVRQRYQNGNDEIDVTAPNEMDEADKVSDSEEKQPQPAQYTDYIPTWAAYNSAISNEMPVTSVNTPPLIAAPAHEWQTLITVLKQAQGISTKVVGEARKTVITLDMGLYKPAKQLQMTRSDCDSLILRPGELHTVMAQLRTIGSYMENSGIDFCWVEAELYGPVTVKQILEGKHVKRGVQAHLTTLQALFMLFAQAFFQENGGIKEQCEDKAQALNMACKSGDRLTMQMAHTDMVQTIESLQISDEMKKFVKQVAKKPLSSAILQYMLMVTEMLNYIRAVRTGDWQLHLKTTEVFVKYYFAHDKLNYARMIPVYLADMEIVSETDPDIWTEFETGNWVVNKNTIPFCAIGADHGLEHINRTMKVSGGLIGITLNPSARTRFFLAAPELACLAEESRQMAGLDKVEAKQHHENSAAKLKQQERNVTSLTKTITQFTNPFCHDFDKLINLATKAVMPPNVENDIKMRTHNGEACFKKFVKERLTSDQVNIWAPMKKLQLQMWSSVAKKTKVSTSNAIIELREDRALFARLLIVCKARPEINLQEAFGKYEFSVVPRALFSADGTLLHTTSKSDLMGILEGLKKNATQDEAIISDEVRRVAIVDGMADLQALTKPEWINTCSDIAIHFADLHWRKYADYNEVHLVFDRYDIQNSLKTSTRIRRQGRNIVVAYHITDTTSISRVSMNNLLAHTQTKDEMTAYLARKLIDQARILGKNLVVAWRDQVEASHRDVARLASNQEEADTKLILHAYEATLAGATSIHIFSPDTDVFVLALRRVPILCKDTCFVTGIREKRRTIKLQPIYTELGPRKAAALPAFHAFSGADITGRFAGKGKNLCWRAFNNLNDVTLDAFAELGANIQPSDMTLVALEKFVCKLYIPQSSCVDVSVARWLLFKKKQAQAENLPPTLAALKPAMMRAHFQAYIWNNDIIANIVLPPPEEYGWILTDGTFMPKMTSLPPAPEAIVHLVKCGCTTTTCSTRRCACYKNKLTCTDLCACSGDDSCENSYNDQTLDSESDSDSN